MTNPTQIRLSTLIRDPILAAIFRQAELDDPAGAEIERPVAPRAGGDAVRVRELVEA